MGGVRNLGTEKSAKNTDIRRKINSRHNVYLQWIAPDAKDMGGFEPYVT